MKVKLSPASRVCVPFGVTEPPSASALMSMLRTAMNVAAIEWLAVTFENV